MLWQPLLLLRVSQLPIALPTLANTAKFKQLKSLRVIAVLAQ